MPLLHVILVFVLVGVVLGLVNRFGPSHLGMATNANVLAVLNYAVIAILIVWVLQLLGVFTYLREPRVGPVS